MVVIDRDRHLLALTTSIARRSFTARSEPIRISAIPRLER
jgi:hypothetical protein